MSRIEQITGSGVPLLLDDIDTDRIVPARYLRCVTFEGLGEHAFEDDRRQDPRHPFDDPRLQSGSILVAGRNFGCGSSREHAPQALLRWGIKAVVAESFAEIFFGNCTALGIPCVRAPRADLEQLAVWIDAHPDGELTVDLVASQIRYGGGVGRPAPSEARPAASERKAAPSDAPGVVPCEMPDSARQALLTGSYDFLSQLLEADDQIHATAAALPYAARTATTG